MNIANQEGLNFRNIMMKEEYASIGSGLARLGETLDLNP